MNPIQTRGWQALLLGFVLVAAACSGPSEESSADTTTTIAAAAATTAPATQVETTTTTAALERSTTTAATRSTRPERSATTAGEPLPIPSPVAPAPATGTRYGVIGCSNTDQAVRGYTEQSAQDLIYGGDLGGGSIVRWGNPNDRRYNLYWDLFDERRPADGYDGVWVQLCIRSGEYGGVFDESEATWMTHIVDQARLRDAGVPIWVSPINFYKDGQVCSSIGPDGPEIAGIVADWAATNLENVFRGPDFGPLGPEHVGQRDDCHPNAVGEALLGQQLIEFIDQA